MLTNLPSVPTPYSGRVTCLFVGGRINTARGLCRGADPLGLDRELQQKWRIGAQSTALSVNDCHNFPGSVSRTVRH